MSTVNFFFSSRRRHTRCLSDWSSDVCSSDLMRVVAPIALVLLTPENDKFVNLALPRLIELLTDDAAVVRREAAAALAVVGARGAEAVPYLIRSEERRVGKG